MLTGKCQIAFQIYIKKAEVREDFEYFINLPKIVQIGYITDFFDKVGITIDAIPRIIQKDNIDIIVFEANTLCLKLEIVTEEHLQFEERTDALIEAVKQANVIFNIHDIF